MADTYIGGDYEIIAVSRFGYLGTSLPKDGSPKVQADEYKCLLDRLNVEKVIVFGNSAGGTSAVRFAIQHPDRCKALIFKSSISIEALPEVPYKGGGAFGEKSIGFR